ncbi:hypothetical protein AYO45_00970 [Gammaproteobacteria bacterium SCGC AG-212-F23]|nr:hypothetical protein AYO45_00970 [Gammaproteobacteria bacterium SCGC AG-212-F23]
MKKLMLILIFILLNKTAIALNTSFLDYSAIYYFTTEDTRMMQQTMMQTLNTASDNTKITWRNPNTGANGYFIPSNTTIQNGVKCRNLTIFNEAHHVPGKSNYQFCKINNDWKIIH